MKAQAIFLTGKSISPRIEIKEFNLLEDLGENQLLIKVNYSGINFADVHMYKGLYQDAPKLPYIPGYEFCGTVLKVGKAVNKFKVGDKVMGGTKFGSYSSHLIVDSWQVINIPNHMSLENSGGFIVSYLTAFICLFEIARVRNGDKILIGPSTGSLGIHLIELLKNYDVKIFGLTSSPSKKKLLEDKGIKAFTFEEFENSSESNFDIAINARGSNIQLMYERLTKSGRLVCLGAADMISKKKSIFKILSTVLKLKKFSTIDLMNDNKGVHGLNVLRYFDSPEVLIKALSKINDFNYSPNIFKIYSPHEIETAYNELIDKKTIGKNLIDWSKI